MTRYFVLTVIIQVKWIEICILIEHRLVRTLNGFLLLKETRICNKCSFFILQNSINGRFQVINKPEEKSKTDLHFLTRAEFFSLSRVRVRKYKEYFVIKKTVKSIYTGQRTCFWNLFLRRCKFSQNSASMANCLISNDTIFWT